MKRKNQATLYFIIAGAICFFVPAALNIYFPKQLLWFAKLGIWFLAAAAFMAFSPIGNHIIGGSNQKAKLPTASWIIFLIIITLISSLLYLSQAIMVLQHAADFDHVAYLHLPILVNHLLRKHYFYQFLYPWTAIAVVTASFSIRSVRHGVALAFSSIVPNVFGKTIQRLLRKNIDVYTDTSTKLFIGICLAAFVIQIYQALKLPPIHTLAGTIIFLALLLISQTLRFKKISSKFEQYRIPPIMMFLLIILTMLVVAILFTFLFIVIQMHGTSAENSIFEQNARPLIFKHQTWVMSWQLWQWSWWLLAIPLVSSLIAKASQGRTVRHTILVVLVIPTLISGGLYLLHEPTMLYISSKLLTSSVIFPIQIIATVGLLILFVPINSSQQLLWLGYYPLKPTKKTRLSNFKRNYFVAVAAFGVFMMGNIQGILLMQMIAALGLFIIFLLMICYC